jgi:predicted nucleic acid-binding protein
MAIVFFDTSALARRYTRVEPGAARVRSLCSLRQRHTLLMAYIGRTEMASALNRKWRRGEINVTERNRAWRLFGRHERGRYHLIALDEGVYRAAERLLFSHSLRALDALQLASALRAAAMFRAASDGFRFCTADARQADAARAEGLTVEFIA